VSPTAGLLIFQTDNAPGFYYHTGNTWAAITPALPKGWLLTGNTATNPATHFIGTSDAQPLLLKVNNQKSGFIDFAVSAAGTSLGYQALLANTGTRNSAVGYQALFANTTGHQNTASGFHALYSNTTGYFNTASGALAMRANLTGQRNSAFGTASLASNTGGNYNTATGAYALFGNTTGIENSAFGVDALYVNSTGNYNAAFGSSVLRANTSSSNSGLGYFALHNNTAGNNNSAFGARSLHQNTIGLNNCAFGSDAGYRNTLGQRNSFLGKSAGYGNTIGNDNICIGYKAGYNNLAGNGNIFIGNSTAEFSLNGTENTIIGFSAGINAGSSVNNVIVGSQAGYGAGNNATFVGSSTGTTSSSYNNNTALGYGARVDASNKVRVGNTSVTSIGGQVGWSSYSDERIKKNIQDNVPGLAFIKHLRTVTYQVDVKKEDQLLGSTGKEEGWAGKYDIEKIKFTGFLAQQVEAAAKAINYEFSGIDNTGQIMGLRYAEFVVPLVKAVQELSADNEAKDARIEALENRLKRVEEILLLQKGDHFSLEGGYLQQNVPNPADRTTVIGYSVPESGEIKMYDVKGRLLKTYPVNKGKGQITISTQEFAAGSYIYTLFSNYNKVDTKRMVIAK
jgi:hypothetical protein